jgi:hypothetical protein
MTPAIEHDKQFTISQRTSTGNGLTTVQEQCPHILGGACASKVIPSVLIDEIYAEDGVEQVTSRNLTLVKDVFVFAGASVSSEMGLRHCTTDDSKSSVRTLGGELVADKGAQPPSCEGVFGERLEFKKLDEILDSSSEVTTNAKLLQCDNHVLPTLRLILAI